MLKSSALPKLLSSIREDTSLILYVLKFFFVCREKSYDEKRSNVVSDRSTTSLLKHKFSF